MASYDDRRGGTSSLPCHETRCASGLFSDATRCSESPRKVKTIARLAARRQLVLVPLLLHSSRYFPAEPFSSGSTVSTDRQTST